MKVQELIEQLKKLPQNDDIIITAMDDHFICRNFEVHSPYYNGQTQEIIMSVYVNDYNYDRDEE